MCTDVTGSHIQSCVTVNGAGNDTLTSGQRSALGSQFHDFIANHNGADLSGNGKPVSAGAGVSQATASMVGAVSQFVGTAEMQAGGESASNWSKISGIRIDSPGANGFVGALTAAGMSNDGRTMIFTGTNPRGVQNLFSQPSDLARIMMHENNHGNRGDLFQYPGFHDFGIDLPARMMLHRFGLDGGCVGSWTDQRC